MVQAKEKAIRSLLEGLRLNSIVPEIQPYTIAENQDDDYFTHGGVRR